MRWLRHAAAVLCSALILGVVVTPLTTPTPSAEAVGPFVVRNGSTSASAAGSCYEIKTKFPDLPSGAYWLQTPTMVVPQQFFCDQTYRGGGWVLIGRGRDGWTQNATGLGDPNSLLTRSRQPDQFAPVQLSAATVDALMNGGAVRNLPNGILLRRAHDWLGNTFTDTNFSLARDQWSWAFGGGDKMTWATFDWGQVYTNLLSNNFGLNDADVRIITSPLAQNKFQGGFAYGANINGSDAATNFVWSPPTNPGYALPYSEVYIRPQFDSATIFESIPDSGTAAIPRRTIASPYATPMQWGVTTRFANSAVDESNNPVQAFAQIGSTMFVGGNFTQVQRGAAASEVIAQSGVAALNATTGEPIRSFAPVINNSVRALVKLPNGLLLVGGDFTQVNGENISGLVALNPTTGAIDPSWTVVLQNRLSSGIVQVRDLEVSGDLVYVSGQFTHLGKSPTSSLVYARNAARINWRTATPDGSWNPEFTGSVYDSDVSEDGSVFWAAGWFDRSRGVPSYRGAAVSTAGGAALVLDSSSKFTTDTWSQRPPNPVYQQSVQQVGNRVYFGGSQHSLFGFDTTNLARVSGTITSLGGDFQAVGSSQGVVYAGCHCGNYAYADAYYLDPQVGIFASPYSSTEKVNWFGAWDAATGKQLPAFTPVELKSSSLGNGVWEIYAGDDGAIWAGGDLTAVNTSPTKSQWLGNFVRFNEISSATPAAPSLLTQTASTATTVGLSWKSNGSGQSYEIIRNDRVIATSKTTSATVARGGSDKFWVRAIDAAGNRSASTPVLSVEESAVPTLWVAKGAAWSYYDAKAAPPVNWFASDFDASAWRTGAAPLGWGGSDIATSLDKPSAERARTMYFRSQVTVPSLEGVSQVTLTAVADDGAVIYVNGQELGRVRMPATVPTGDTYATAAVSYATAGAQPITLDVPVAMLKQGVNVIAAETHLNYASTPSASFMATLSNTTAYQTAAAPAVPAGVSQTATSAGSVSLAWDAVNGAASYEVLRDGYVIATSTEAKATVATGGSNSFTVRSVTVDGRRSGPSAAVSLKSAQVLVGSGSTWVYRYDLAAPAADWNTAGADVSTWGSGAAPLGWGGSDIATDLNRPTTERAKTMYFRHDLSVTDAAALGTVTVNVVADDGTVVYVNGTEIGRVRMPAGAISHTSYASQAVSYTSAKAAPVSFTVPAGVLVNGSNIVSAETHLNYLSAPSASFEMTITAG